jgi:integrase
MYTSKSARFPIKIKTGSITVAIYRSVSAKGYTSYVVAWSLNGERKLKTFADLAEAKREAKGIAESIAVGETALLDLRGEDRLAYSRALDALSDAKTPLDVAAAEYAECVRLLAGMSSVTEACREYVRRHGRGLPKVTVSDAVKECLDGAKRDGKSYDRRHQLETYLARFAEAFNVQLTTVEPKHVSDWLAGLPLAPRTKKNARDVVVYFFKWAVGRGYLPRGTDIMEHVQQYAKNGEAEVTIFTAQELSRLLVHAKPALVPFLSIAAFGGLRGREIQRLDWSQVDLKDGWIEVSGRQAKTRVRRLVPVSENLKAWLLPLAKASGAVCPYKNVIKQLMEVAHDAGVTWRKNGLRHTAISARVAITNDVPKVALESGNSVSVIQSNYLRVMRPEQARAWFSIVPQKAANILPMVRAA